VISRDVVRRVVSISWWFSQLRDAWLNAWDVRSQTPFAKIYRTIRPYTMCGNARLRGLYEAVQWIVTSQVPGALVECGTARGGSAALMGLTLRQLSEDRVLWLFDTFEGLPPPTKEDPDWNIAKAYTGRCRGTKQEVISLFDRLDILKETKFVQGLLEETLSSCEIGPIALLHIDCDWYDSVKACLDHLYDCVSSGGVIQIDDYGHWAGARKAVEEFIRARSLAVRWRRLDYTGRQFIKP